MEARRRGRGDATITKSLVDDEENEDTDEWKLELQGGMTFLILSLRNWTGEEQSNVRCGSFMAAVKSSDAICVVVAVVWWRLVIELVFGFVKEQQTGCFRQNGLGRANSEMVDFDVRSKTCWAIFFQICPQYVLPYSWVLFVHEEQNRGRDFQTVETMFHSGMVW
eukprot:scaffold353_cov185-Amphora_coffeaeformis.AAC.7